MLKGKLDASAEAKKIARALGDLEKIKVTVDAFITRIVKISG